MYFSILSIRCSIVSIVISGLVHTCICLSDDELISGLRAHLAAVGGPGLQHASTEFLTHFLRTEANDVQATVERIKMYARYRREHSDMFLTVGAAASDRKHQIFYFQPDVTPSGESIVYVKPSNWNVQRDNVSQAFSAFVPFIELAANLDPNKSNQGRLPPDATDLDHDHPNHQLYNRHFSSYVDPTNGYVVLLDMKDWTWRHAYNMASPAQLSMLFELIEKALPVRIRKIHVINQNFLYEIAFNVARQFMSQRFTNLFVTHGWTLVELERAVPMHVRPTVVGGLKDLHTYTTQDIIELDTKLAEIRSNISVRK